MIYNISEKIKFLFEKDKIVEGRFLLFPVSCFYNLVEVDSGGNRTGKIYYASFIAELWRFKEVFKYGGVTCFSGSFTTDHDLKGREPIPFPKFKICQKHHLMGDDFVIEKADFDKGQWVYNLGFLKVWLDRPCKTTSLSTIDELPEKNLISLVNAFKEK